MVFPRKAIFDKVEIASIDGDNQQQLYRRKIDERIERSHRVSGDSLACQKGWCAEQGELLHDDQPWILPVRMTTECISSLMAVVTSEGEKSMITHFYIKYQHDTAAKKVSFADVIKGNYIKTNHWLYSHGIPLALFVNIDAYKVEKFKVTSGLYKQQWFSILGEEQKYRDERRDTQLAPRWRDERNRMEAQYPSKYTPQDEAALLLTIDHQYEILRYDMNILDREYPTECEIFNFLHPEMGQFSKDYVVICDPDNAHPDLRAVWDNAPGEHHRY